MRMNTLRVKRLQVSAGAQKKLGRQRKSHWFSRKYVGFWSTFSSSSSSSATMADLSTSLLIIFFLSVRVRFWSRFCWERFICIKYALFRLTIIMNKLSGMNREVEREKYDYDALVPAFIYDFHIFFQLPFA